MLLIALQLVAVSAGMRQDLRLDGFYSLSVLGAKLSDSAHRIEVEPNCADDVFVVHLSHAPVADVVQALVFTGRVAADQTSDGWRLRRPPSFSDRAKVLERYLKEAFKQDLEWRETALTFVKQIWSAPQTQQAEAIAGLNLQAERKQITWRQFALADNALTNQYFPPLLVPNELCSKGRAGVGTLFVVTVADRPELFYLDLAKKGNRFGPQPFGMRPPDCMGMKLAFDPALCSAMVNFVFGIQEAPIGLASEDTPAFLRGPEDKPPTLDKVFSPADYESYRSRIASTVSELNRPGLGRKAALPEKPLRVSDGLLTIAEASDQELVSYVSPLSDRFLRGNPEASIASEIARANKGDYDVTMDLLTDRERVNTRFDPRPDDVNPPVFSAKLCGSVAAVRTEVDFLDQLVQGPLGPDLDSVNNLRTGRPPTLSTLAKDVASLPMSHWQGSIFSSRYLDFTNPTAFFPFARSLAASPKLLDAVQKLNDGKDLEYAPGDLDRPARDGLLNGIVTAAPFCDYIGSGEINRWTGGRERNPVAFSGLAQSGTYDAENFKLHAAREGGNYLFWFGNPVFGFWRARVSGVDFGAGR